MGILRNREELLPVTCAVLKENEREMFFNDVRRKASGNMDRVAKSVGVPVTTLQDWVNGTANVPYITLQRLASEFEVEMPTVTELRREFQQIAPAPTARPSARMPSNPGIIGSGPAPSGVHREPAAPRRPPRQERPPRPERQARPGRSGRPERGPQRSSAKAARAQQAKPPQHKKAPAPPAPSGPRVPKLSDKVAYWTGTVFGAGRRDGDAVVFTADAAYAEGWGALTQGLFGVAPALTRLEGAAAAEARLPAAGLEEFVNRLDLKPDAPRPPAPRWAWSNPDWKRAFLEGLMDAAAELVDGPALRLPALGDPLRRSAEKLLAGLSVPCAAAEDGTLSVAGAEALEKYWRAVGAENPKLRSALEALFPGVAPAEQAAAAKPAAPAPSAGGEGKAGRGKRRRRGRGRGRREGVPAQTGTAAVPEVSDHGTEPREGGHFTEPGDVPPPPSPERTDDSSPEV